MAHTSGYLEDCSGCVNEAKNVTTYTLNCSDQMFIPAWMPQTVTRGVIVYRGVVFLLCMGYLFFGINVACDKFMASIQMITSKRREIQVKGEDGKEKTVVVRVWNETVANLTLMAMGCSAPEILLGILEVVGKGFEADELGPGVAVGGAAINMFLVIGICNLTLPRNEVRRVKRISVFLVNAIWSLFSFLWIFIILKITSPGVVEIWEALLMFFFFPLTVFCAYLADRHVSIYDYLSKTYGMGRHGVIVETTDEAAPEHDFHFKQFAEEMNDEEVQDFEDTRRAFIMSMRNLRRKYSVASPDQLELMAAKELFDRGTKSKEFYHRLATKMLFGMTSTKIQKTMERPKLDVTSLYQEYLPKGTPATVSKMKNSKITKVFFRPGHYTIMENIGEFTAKVVREGGDLTEQILVDYTTEDGGALAHRDYVPQNGTLIFEPGEACKNISIKVLEDNIYKGDQHFYIRLFNIRVNKYYERRLTRGDIAADAYEMTSIKSKDASCYPNALTGDQTQRDSDATSASGFSNEVFEDDVETGVVPADPVVPEDRQPNEFQDGANAQEKRQNGPVHFYLPDDNEQIKNDKACLVCPSLATIMILDDDHQGIFSLTEQNITITESVGHFNMKIIRCGGSRGRVVIPYRTEEGTAKEPRDYQHCEGEVIFEDGEIEKSIPLIITVNTSYQKDVFFYFTLGEPRRFNQDDHDPSHYLRQLSLRNVITERQRIQMEGRPQLGDIATTVIRLEENKAFKSSVDKFMLKANLSLKNWYSTWFQQFTDLLHLDLSDEDGTTREANFMDYIFYILFLPWRFIAAFVPPESMVNGYPCFVLSVFLVGLMSSLLGDFASQLGCTVGLNDSVTAVAIVSFGTSFPDLMVSRFAAIKNKHADASVNNVTGSKSLNVYFGIGLAWSSAAIYHSLNGDQFLVEPGNMGFSVALYVSMAVVALIILMLKRLPEGGGELGGPMKYRLPTSILFLGAWLTYVILYSLQVYGHIDGF